MRRQAFFFAACLALTQLAVLGFCFWAATQEWFSRRVAYPMLPMMGYAHRARGMNCDVVLYGDSSALADLLPAVIEARTGLKACNIAEVRGIGDFEGVDFPVEEYLRGNRAPRFLVAAWTPSNFNLGHERMFVKSREGYAYAMYYDRGAWLWRGMVAHPEPALEFLTWAEYRMGLDVVLRLTHKEPQQDEQALRAAGRGAWVGAHTAQTGCVGQPFVVPPTNRRDNAAGVAAFRRRFASAGTRVLVDVTPVAECDPELGQYRELTAGLYDNRFEVLPIGEFVDHDIHLGETAAQRFSMEVSEQIVASMRGEEAGGGQ